MATHVQRDAVAQVLWRMRALPIRVGSRVSPRFMSRHAHGASRVHLGCGANVIPGWANLDVDGPSGVTRFDLTRPLPFSTSSVDLIYTEHFLEHLSKERGVRLLRECARILRPGATLRISTPDLSTLVAEYSSGRLTEWADMDWSPASPADLLNEGMRLWGHLYLWDEAELTRTLGELGFTSVTRMPWRQSAHDELCALETRPDHRDLIVDATR